MTLPNDRGLFCHKHSGYGEGGGGGGGVGSKSTLNCRSATQMTASQFQNMLLLAMVSFVPSAHLNYFSINVVVVLFL